MNVAIDAIEPADLPESGAAYTHGTLVQGAERLVFVSGQPPWARDAPVPEDFDAQCRLAWRNVERVLTEAGLALGNLAKVTIYLSVSRSVPSTRTGRSRTCSREHFVGPQRLVGWGNGGSPSAQLGRISSEWMRQPSSVRTSWRWYTEPILKTGAGAIGPSPVAKMPT